MKEVMGKDDDEDPTDIEIERFKEDGVQDTVRETIDACNSEARDETDATVRETKYKAFVGVRQYDRLWLILLEKQL